MRQRGLDELWPLGALLRALLVFAALADAVLSLELWLLRHQEARWAVHIVLDVLAPVRLIAAVAVAALALYLASRPKRAFRRVLLILALSATLLSVRTGQPLLIGTAAVDGMVALLAGSLWPEATDPLSSRLGWSLLGLAGATAGVAAWLLLGQRHSLHPAPLFLGPLALAGVAAASGLALLDRNPPLPGRWDPAAALPLYEAWARSGVHPFALLRDKRHVWCSDRRSFLAVGCRTGVALALGPAIGPPDSARRLHAEFRAACRRRGWRPAFYQVPEETLEEWPRTRRLMVGSEAFVELDRFSLRGRSMANLRHQVTKARRLGVTIDVLSEPDVAWDVQAAMRSLAAELAGGRRIGEMTFSVGNLDEPAGVSRTVGVARDGQGRLAAYVTWLWLPAARTLILDEVKRHPEAPSGAVELAIVECLERFRGRAARASLGLAPITGAGQAARLAGAEVLLRRVLGVTSAAPGLYAFKAKFQPTWEPRHLVVERMVDVPAVLVAAFLLHFPEVPRRYWSLGRALTRPL